MTKQLLRIGCAVLAGALLCGAFALAAPTDGTSSASAPSSLTLIPEEPAEAALRVGGQLQLSVADTAEAETTGGSASGSAGASDSGGGWTVIPSDEDTACVTVDENGLVTAVAEGTAEVAMAANGGVVSCRITVSGYTVTDIALSGETEMQVGSSQTLTAQLQPEGADAALTWVSDNEDILSVSQDGTVEAVGAGTATITAEADGVSGSLTITVRPVLTGLTLSSTSMELRIGESRPLSAAAVPDGLSLDGLTWRSSNDAIAYYQNGSVYARRAGQATITASVGSITATCTVNVASGSVSMNTDRLTLTVGQTAQLTATTYGTAENQTITWSSSNSPVASVDQNGKVTAVKAGAAVIYAEVGGLRADCVVTVQAKQTGTGTASSGSTGTTSGYYAIANSSGTGGVLYMPGTVISSGVSLYSMPDNIPQTVYLTIDGAADATAETIAETLTTYSTQATFFVPVGDLYASDDALRHIAGTGSSIGLLLTAEQAAGDDAAELLEAANSQLSVITGIPTRLVRISGGSGNVDAETVQKLIHLGYRVWDWSDNARETSLSTDSCYQALTKALNTTEAVTVRMGVNTQTNSVLSQLLPYLRYCGTPTRAIQAGDNAVCHTAVG